MSHGQAPHPLHPRPDLREHHPRRRDQPHAAAHAGGAARGDAGIPGHHRRRPLSARAAAVRARDREPDRTGRHASAARGAARSLHVQRRDRLSRRRRRAAHPGRDDDGRASRRLEQVATGTDLERARCSCATCRPPTNVVDYALRLVRATRPGDPTAPQPVREWVRWGAGPRAGQALLLGAKAIGAARRPQRAVAGRRAAGRAAGAASSRAAQLPGRGRRPGSRSGDRPAPRSRRTSVM